MATKICSTCKEEKDTSEFYRNKRNKDGLCYRCIPCEKARFKEAAPAKVIYLREYRKRNRAAVLANKRRYREETKEHQREMGRALYEKKKEKRAAEARAYAAKNRAVLEEKRKQRRLAEPMKFKAQAAVQNAVFRGALPVVRTLTCQICSDMATHYHHESYEESRRLDVVPLCAKCHKGLHAGIVSLSKEGVI